MAKVHVYYNVSYPHRGHSYLPHCFACATRKIMYDFRVVVELEITDFDSVRCAECDRFISDTIEI